MNTISASENEIFDKATLMARLDNDEELASEVLNVYLEDTPIQIASLKSADTQKDLEAIVRQGHTIKGASSNVSALRMRQVAIEIETAGKKGELEIISSLVAELEEQFRTLQEYLNK